jgi:hypothetical protein
VGLYFFLDNMFAMLTASKMDFPLAAQNCTWACHQACAIPPSAFVPIDTNATAIPWEYPSALRRKLPAAFQAPLLAPVYEKVHTGPGDVWWCDPRQAPAYCSWSWTEEHYQVSKEHIDREPGDKEPRLHDGQYVRQSSLGLFRLASVGFRGATHDLSRQLQRSCRIFQKARLSLSPTLASWRPVFPSVMP